METGKLTPKSNTPVSQVRYTGSFGQPDGFGSILEVVVNVHGHARLTLQFTPPGTKIPSDRYFWSVVLDNDQRRALGEQLTQYEPILFERF